MINIKIEPNNFYNLDCRDGFKLMKEQGVQVSCIITSPPYWAMRKYDIEYKPKWEDGFEGELGSEPNFSLYIKHLCDIFDLAKDCLRDDGTLWVNLGDTYSTQGGQNRDTNKDYSHYDSIKLKNRMMGVPIVKDLKLPSKCLCMIPERFAIEMTNRGWILRNVIIWHKNNCMPSSAKDRFTVDFEYLYFFSKKKKYYFKQQIEKYKTPIKERYRPNSYPSKTIKKSEPKMFGKDVFDGGQGIHDGKRKKQDFFNKEGRNKRCVWDINTQPHADRHFAIFPDDLVKTPIKAGCPKYICSKCGKIRKKKIKHSELKEDGEHNVKYIKEPYAIQKREGIVSIRDLPYHEKIRTYLSNWRKKRKITIDEIENYFGNQAGHHWFEKNGSYPSKEDWIKLKELLNFDDKFDKVMTKEYFKDAKKQNYNYKEIGWDQCDCNEPFISGIVLDPFAGIGTTLKTAWKLGRNYIGFEISKKYCEIIEKNLQECNNHRLDGYLL